MSKSLKENELLPIGYVARMSGISAHTIRMWERRYGTVTPQRTETNRRLYTREDVRRLQLIRQLSKRGYSVGKTSDLDTEYLESLERESATGNAAMVRVERTSNEDVLALCKHAVNMMDAKQLEEALQGGLVSASLPGLLSDVIAPLIHWVGSCWQSGDLRISQEHLATQTIISFLTTQRRQMVLPATAPRIVAATPATQVHELGVQLAATMARDLGWEELYFGPDLPAHEIAYSAIEHNASAVLLSVVMLHEAAVVEKELVQLRAALPTPFPIVLGGKASDKLAEVASQHDITIVTRFSDLRKVLSELAVA